MATSKSKLRQELKAIRLSISQAEHTLNSRSIVKRLQRTLDWSTVKTVHYFEPIEELLEVDIAGLITHLEDNYPKIQLFAPRKIKGKWQMVSLKTATPPVNFDVIVVPMLGFDKTLHRLGYGGGYYDTFLATQAKARKVGVCFESGRVEKIPAETHDIGLDIVVTEAKTYSKL